MANWYDNFNNPANVELGTCWQVQTGSFHIFRGPSARAGGRDINWLRGDNVNSSFAAKRISHPSPSSLDLSKSVQWDFIIKAEATALNAYKIWLFCSGPDVLLTSAITDGYYIEIQMYSDVFNLARANTDGTITGIDISSVSKDANEHSIRVTREVSGANRFWRTYYDDVLIGGPVNDATYSDGQYYGVCMDERMEIGEILISS